LILPVDKDLSTRFFHALLCSQVLVDGSVADLDQVITPADQQATGSGDAAMARCASAGALALLLLGISLVAIAVSYGVFGKSTYYRRAKTNA
jgi:hypothetical protein